MADNEHVSKQQRQKAEHEEKVHRHIISIGLVGGLFATGLTYFAHFLRFIPFGPGVIWQNMLTTAGDPVLRGPFGHLIAITLLSLLSIGVAYLYFYILRRMDTPWVGIWFGLALWVIIFLGLNPMIPGTKAVNELTLNTNIYFISLFIVYGLFVGYSISYQYSDKI